MEERSGWLERSLTQARENIEARPEHLKPERYRSKGKAKTTVKKGGRAGRST
jgi:hypothetical protein